MNAVGLGEKRTATHATAGLPEIAKAATASISAKNCSHRVGLFFFASRRSGKAG